MISDKQQEISDKSKKINGYRRLIAWQKADVLAHEVYAVTENFPKTEVLGITSQLRRAVLSIPANIIEGYARMSKNEFHHFLSIALGSLAEVDYFLSFSYKRNLINGNDYQKIAELKEECGKLIWGLYQSQGKERQLEH